MSQVLQQLESAWQLRLKFKLHLGNQALRVFHGPGEGIGGFRSVSIDRFGDVKGAHFWVTVWEEDGSFLSPEELKLISSFLKSKDAASAVLLRRPKKGTPDEPVPLLGLPPQERIAIIENDLRFKIQLLGTRHPGLFLDHQPLRQWLAQNLDRKRVLNTFAYTGSLSVAAQKSGADSVITLDLSAPSIAWAKENWALNGFSFARAEFMTGDVFEWLPKWAKRGERFDCVILDPPSFSRGKKGNFSTSKDLKKLHELALGVLSPDGFLVTSINSAKVSRAQYEKEIAAAASATSVKLKMLYEIELPKSFPTRPQAPPSDRYIKGWVLKS
ncbi:MAG: class I SAM-dependent methyltransferase [Bdellovibrionota bacterium]